MEIRGQDVFERVRYCVQFNEVANTDLQKVFDLILTTAVENCLPWNKGNKKRILLLLPP